MPIAAFLRTVVRSSVLLAPAFGMGVSVIVIPIAYRYLAPTSGYFGIICLASFVSFLVGVWSYRNTKLESLGQKAFVTALCLIAPAVLPLVALLAGGSIFQAWQLNTHDLSNYLTIAIETRNFSLGEIQSETSLGPRNPYALSLMGDRISVPVVMGAFQGWAGESFRMTHAGFILAAIVSGASAAAALLQRLLDEKTSKKTVNKGIIGVLLSLSLAGGYFGQIFLDLNAWSAGYAFPLFILAILSVLTFVSVGKISTKHLIYVWLSHTSLLFAYPEQFAMAGTLEVALIVFLILKKRLSVATSIQGVLAPVFAGLLFSTVLYENTLGFLVRQSQFTSGGAPDGWKIWAKFIFWRMNTDQLSELQNPIEIATSLAAAGATYMAILALSSVLLAEAGLYFLDITGGQVAGLFAVFITAVSLVSFMSDRRRQGDSRAISFFVVLITGLIVGLNIFGKNWEAFKSIQWFGPLIAIAIAARANPLGKSKKVKVLVVMLPLIWFTSQATFAIERITTLAENHSRPHPNAYPNDGSLRDTEGFRNIYDQGFFEKLPWQECDTSVVVLKDQQIQTFIETDILASGSTLVFGSINKPACSLFEQDSELVFSGGGQVIKHKFSADLPYPSRISQDQYTEKVFSYLGRDT